MAGGHTDNYYYQLMSNVRRYKGMEKPATAGPPVTINIRGSFNQWDKVSTTYYDHAGDTGHRNSPGQGQAGPYINTTGRNDITVLKVACDESSVYFYAETNEALTPYSDPNWMLLFIDCDQSRETGWEGYDRVINIRVLNRQNTVMAELNKDGSAGKIMPVSYKATGNKLMIQVKRSDLTRDGKLAFEFHWADNIPKIGDISGFFVNGDNAPERRANFRFNP
jgi:hypothetical protein